MTWLTFGVILALVALVVILALAGGLLYWWVRRRNRIRLIAFVALVREPVAFDPAVLARIAGKVWHADLGDGESEGVDGFVVGVDLMKTIMHQGRMFLINSFPTPYTEDVDKAAEGIADMRIRDLFRQHQAWFSCDAMGIDGRTSEEDVLDCYRRLGKLFVELLDERCLLILMPDSSLAFPINEDTETALRSNDPVKALMESLTLPIIEVDSDDPLMVEAVDKARQGWPQFVAAYEASAGENFSVKAPVSHAGHTEFIWISVTGLEAGPTRQNLR